MSRPKVIECGACGHPHYHCPVSGCNADECECMKFRQVTELELRVLEKIAAGEIPTDIRTVGRLCLKGCLVEEEDESSIAFVCITVSGHAVLLGTPPQDLRDILGLVVERPPTIESLAALTRDQREELREWAVVSAITRRCDRPALLDSLPMEET